MSHKQERLNECDLCQYSTTHISNLNKHRLTHTQEKPYQCNICEKSYKSADGLKHHTVLHKDIFETKKVCLISIFDTYTEIKRAGILR